MIATGSQSMKRDAEDQQASSSKHRFLGYYRREVEGQPVFIYRCICGYVEAVPVCGGPHQPLDFHFRPRADARSLAKHLNLERGHELN
jgi:hypothetical protein